MNKSKSLAPDTGGRREKDRMTSVDILTTPPAHEDNGTTHMFDSFDLFIHPHWYQFPAIAPIWHYAMGIFITFVSIFGSLGNLLVMYIFGT